MQRDKLTGLQAFATLTRASKDTNIKLVDVARWLVDEHESALVASSSTRGRRSRQLACTDEALEAPGCLRTLSTFATFCRDSTGSDRSGALAARWLWPPLREVTSRSMPSPSQCMVRRRTDKSQCKLVALA
jgi:hypothetical protein